MTKDKILILGAGASGMACAFELFKHKKEFLVIEKKEQVGGLAKTLKIGKFRTDLGPHRFYTKNRVVFDFVLDILGKRLKKVKRRSRFYSNEKFYDYPIKIANVLENLGAVKSTKIAVEIFSEKMKHILEGRKQFTSFEDKVISEFGRTLAELNFLDYTEKLWGLPCCEISTDWIDQRMDGLSVKSVLERIFLKKHDLRTFVDEFYYPETGTGLIYETIEKVIGEDFIKKNVTPTKIVHKNKKIVEVFANDNCFENSFKPNYLVTSIPITEFLELLHPKPPEEVIQSAQKLEYRSQVYLFMIINKKRIMNDHWIYFPDKKVPFCRLSEPKNFSKKMSPKDKTSLLVEFFCRENDKIWNMPKKEIFEITLEWLEKLDFLKGRYVEECYTYKEKFAYPIYDLMYRNNLDKIKEYLDQFGNLSYIGRSGRFRYTNQDHSIEMGIKCAKNIVDHKSYNLDDIGSESIYFEKGCLKTN